MDGSSVQTQGSAQVIFAEIPIRLPTLNVWQRMHWAKRRQLAKTVARELWISLRHQIPERPFKHCSIKIERVSTKEPDPDGLTGSAKCLLDALQPASKRHPYGLGVILDDNRECIGSPEIIHVPGKGTKTRIWIQELK